MCTTVTPPRAVLALYGSCPLSHVMPAALPASSGGGLRQGLLGAPPRGASLSSPCVVEAPEPCRPLQGIVTAVFGGLGGGFGSLLGGQLRCVGAGATQVPWASCPQGPRWQEGCFQPLHLGHATPGDVVVELTGRALLPAHAHRGPQGV